MRLHEAEQALLLKEGVRPANMVESFATPTAFASFPQDRTESNSHTLVDRVELLQLGVFEGHVPTAQREILFREVFR